MAVLGLAFESVRRSPINRATKHEIDRRGAHGNRVVGAGGLASHKLQLHGCRREDGLGNQARLSSLGGLGEHERVTGYRHRRADDLRCRCNVLVRGESYNLLTSKRITRSRGRLRRSSGFTRLAQWRRWITRRLFAVCHHLTHREYFGEEAPPV